MAQSAYSFRPLTAADLPLLRRWLMAPHVAEWWGDAEEQFALVRGDLDDPRMDQYLVAFGERPFGYVQAYDPGDWAEQAFGLQPRGTRGIDPFIGESEMIDRGHGAAFIRAFVEQLRAAGAPRVLIDPDPDNARAVRAYEKAGFRKDRLVNTPDGLALLMVWP